MGSRFLREIDKQFLDMANIHAVGARHAVPPQRGATPSRNFPTSDPMPKYEDMSQDEPGLRPGTRVNHAKFGIGKVMRVDGSGESASAVILFGDRVPRTLMLRFAKLEILD